MAKAKLKLYPYLTLDEKGELQAVHAFTWPTADKMETDQYSTRFIIALPMIEVEVTHPDDCRSACLALLKQFKGEQISGHQLLMTKLQFTENGLLGLAAPDIIDAE